MYFVWKVDSLSETSVCMTLWRHTTDIIFIKFRAQLHVEAATGSCSLKNMFRTGENPWKVNGKKFIFSELLHKYFSRILATG